MVERPRLNAKNDPASAGSLVKLGMGSCVARDKAERGQKPSEQRMAKVHRFILSLSTPPVAPTSERLGTAPYDEANVKKSAYFP